MKFKFIKYTKVWFAVSLTVILIGFGAMINNKVKNGRSLEYGIDFTGGTLMELTFDEATPKSEEIADVFNGIRENVISQINITDENSYIIQSKNLSEYEYANVTSALADKIGPFKEVRFTTIGPKIGETLKRKASVALALALIAIVLFVAYAFRHVPRRVSSWRFGVCAIAALAHDIIITLGIFALLGYEINAFFITALLTIMGFSVHDTIVVFDRIRENLSRQSRDDSFADVADRSLNETLMRSINTSVSTLFTLAALYVWGAESIRIFIFALMIGIVVGTYSSIFIASPLLTLWQNVKPVRR